MTSEKLPEDLDRNMRRRKRRVRGKRGLDRSDRCKKHETVPRWMRIQSARATGLLVGYEHGMSNRMEGRGQIRSVVQQPVGIVKPQRTGMGPVTGCGKGERDMGLDGRRKAPSNSTVGSGNQSPWTGEPWANHGEPGRGKSGKSSELREGREVSPGVRVDPEASRSMA